MYEIWLLISKINLKAFKYTLNSVFYFTKKTTMRIMKEFEWFRKELNETYWKEKVKNNDYTISEWNQLSLWRYVEYTKWIPIKECTYE